MKRPIGDNDFVNLDDIHSGSMKDPEYRRAYLQAKIRREFARMVKDFRVRAGLTQTQLAMRMGIPQSFIARIESLEDGRIPTFDLLFRFVYAFRAHARLTVEPPQKTHIPKKELVLA